MTLNTISLSTSDVLKTLKAGWTQQKEGRLTASWMLHGRPGVGKTQVVQQLADQIGADLFDLRLTTIEPQDLRGLPYYDHAAKKTVWYRPEDLPDQIDRPAVLFLDELTAAAPNLQPTVYGLLQERRVGRHVLPDSVFIVAAGNSVEDGAIAYDMGTALSDRLIHLHLHADASDWIENFAIPHGIDATVTAFLRGRPDLLDTTEQALSRGELITCTPRAWERVSKIMQTVPDRRIRQAMIAGTVGEAAAATFAVVADDIAATVRIHDLLEASNKSRSAYFPDTMHGLNAVVFGLVGAANSQTIETVIEAMEQIRHLSDLRPGEDFEAMPLAELCAFGFEMLMTKALAENLTDAFARSSAYARYADSRRESGVA
ncbi:MAG: AAA family ATPase [Roseobacter sp.]